MGGGRPQEEADQMQASMKGSGRKLSRRWGVGYLRCLWAQDLKSALPGGPLLSAPTPPAVGCSTLWGPGCRLCEAPGFPPLRREQNRTPAPADQGHLRSGSQETEGGAGAAPHLGAGLGRNTSQSSTISTPLHKNS